MLIKCCLSTGQVKRGKNYLKWKYCKEQISYMVTTYDGKKKQQETKKRISWTQPESAKNVFQYQQSLQSVFSIIIIIIIMEKSWLRASSIKDSSNCQGDRLQYYAASAPCKSSPASEIQQTGSRDKSRPQVFAS